MNIRKILFFSILSITPSVYGQDIYKMESFANSDLTGTARFVGMGGAMSALGADISVMNTNPAGIGLYRRTDIALTGGLNIQPNASEFCGIDKTRASFDQAGFVYSAQLGSKGIKYVNFGFNYNKRKNFKNYIGVNNFRTAGLSQTIEMMDLAYTNRWLDLDDYEDREWTTPMTCLGYDTQLLEKQFNGEGKLDGYNPVQSEKYNYQRVQWGGIQEYDFNLSLNWNDQIFAGFTFGVYNVDMHTATDYEEMVMDGVGGLHPYLMENEEVLSGSGYDFKFGLILRPIEESPFRIGVAVHTPTFYNLKSDAWLYMKSPFESVLEDGTKLPYTEAYYSQLEFNEYKIRTPWKVNLSLGTTVGNFLAIDAEYEYQNLASSKISYLDYEYSTWGDNKDQALNEEAKRFLKSQSTVRIGAEARITPNIYTRLGYNFVSAPFKKDAYLNLFTESPSYYYNVNTDYVNLGNINRYTAGLGFRGKHLYADLTYQYQQQSGDLYTFHVPSATSEANRLEAAKVDLNKHQLMMTVGYKF